MGLQGPIRYTGVRLEDWHGRTGATLKSQVEDTEERLEGRDGCARAGPEGQDRWTRASLESWDGVHRGEAGGPGGLHRGEVAGP